MMIEFHFVVVEEFICSKSFNCLSFSLFKLPKFDSNFLFLRNPRVCRSSSGAARSENWPILASEYFADANAFFTFNDSQSEKFTQHLTALTSFVDDFFVINAPSFRTRRKQRSIQNVFIEWILPFTLLARAMFFKRWNSFFAVRSFLAAESLANWSSAGSEKKFDM